MDAVVGRRRSGHFQDTKRAQTLDADSRIVRGVRRTCRRGGRAGRLETGPETRVIRHPRDQRCFRVARSSPGMAPPRFSQALR